MPLAHSLLALAVVLVWGTNFVVIALGLSELTPFLFSALRFLLTALPWLLFLPRPKVAWRYLIAFGVLIGAGQFGLLFFAMHRYISPGLASLLIQAQVIFTIALAVFIRNQRIQTLQVVALMIAVTGLGLVVWKSASESEGAITLLGAALVLCAALCWALGNIVVQTVGKIDVIAFLSWSSLFAVPPLIALTVFVDGVDAALHALRSAGIWAWIAVVYQAAANTIFGFGAWNWLLARYPASTVTPFGLLIPVFGMSASYLILREPLPLWKWAAAALVIAGLALNTYASQQKPVAP